MIDANTAALHSYEREQVSRDNLDHEVALRTQQNYREALANLTDGDLLGYLSDFGIGDSVVIGQMLEAVQTEDALGFGAALMGHVLQQIYRVAREQAEESLS